MWIEPPHTPPRRRRVRSAEAAPTWYDFHVVVDVEENDEGLHELHCHLHLWGRDAHFHIQLRHLFFWMMMLLLLLPASAFQVVPRMPSAVKMAQNAAGSALMTPQRRHLVQDITALQAPVALFDTNPADGPAIFSESLPSSDAVELEQCLLDATTDSNIEACMRQIQGTSLDELSVAIANSGCEYLSSADDGTIAGIVGQLLHAAKDEGALSLPSLRRLAVRSCVSAGMHKLAVCALPALSCMVHLPAMPEALDVLQSLVN